MQNSPICAVEIVPRYLFLQFRPKIFSPFETMYHAQICGTLLTYSYDNLDLIGKGERSLDSDLQVRVRLAWMDRARSVLLFGATQLAQAGACLCTLCVRTNADC